MTTLVLGAADSLIGSVAGAATSLAGQAVAGLFGAGGSGADTVRVTQGPRLGEMSGLTSTEGAPIPRLYGRARLGGQLIWATRFEEVASTTTNVERQGGRSGGKSLDGRSSTPTRTTVTTTYSYMANLAIGLCEGPVAFVRRVCADGREIDLATLNMRVHRGGEDQAPDPLIAAKEGPGSAPAYRGLAYVVFERLPLGPYGNRVPQFSFEIVRPVGDLGPAIRSVCLIPGSTEFGYDTVPVTRILGLGASAPENVHQLGATTDVAASLDALQALCPNLANVSLVVSWFGDDLRAGACTIRPKVDLAGKATAGGDWTVSGLTRATAGETSRAGDAAAYGGTPSDASVVRLIGELKARGLSVTLYPFVMMDVPPGNDRPDPWSGAASQPPYPWRGRITCDPAPGRPGSVDGTAAAGPQVAALFGAAAASHFTVAGASIASLAAPDWGFRRLALHYAHLARAAGGVDAFVVGSELVGLTRVRSSPGAYPAVAALAALAADLRAVLGAGTKLVYAADWTEYGAHVLGGGSEVRFPLDPLWASEAIDAVGIDFYPPLGDWRDGSAHLDAQTARGAHDVDRLRDRVAGGEAFDWHYASEADRLAQVRTPITDGPYGKPWTFRAKDLAGWWSHAHVERVAGIETGPTAWIPGSKPIWLTEIGVPAVDKGANAPNLFPDPKSSESSLPPFSTGWRDDLIQARALLALLSRFDPALPGHEAAMNPPASLYPGRMVDPAHVSVWCWDARPFPAFPDFGSVWADGPNWSGGHWITGRLEGAPLDRMVAAILADFGLDPGRTQELDGFADGYVIDRPMSARDALEPLASLYGFDAVARADGIGWRGRGGTAAVPLPGRELVDREGAPLVSRSRAQETDLPGSVRLGFTDAAGEYGRASVGSRRLAGTSRRDLAVDVALVLPRGEAQRLGDTRLQDFWSARESAEVEVSPRAIGLEPGDVVALGDEGRLHRIIRILDGASRRLSLKAVEPEVFQAPGSNASAVRPRLAPAVAGPALALVLDLPAGGAQPETLQHLAVAADPWPGAVAVWRAGPDESFALHQVIGMRAIIGRTLTVLPAGPVWRWDRASIVDVEVSPGAALVSLEPASVLAGGNVLAVLGPDGVAEVLAFGAASLVGERRYRLSGLLRGLGGTEAEASRTLASGAPAVMLDASVTPLATALSDLGRTWTYRVGPASRDHADPAYVELTATVGAAALRPLAPVHVRARRTAEGVLVSWIRRTRRDGDSWDVVEVPLAEEAESYAIDVMSAGVPVRSLAATASSALYRAADEIADFGAAQPALTVRIAQVSQTVGRGRETVATLPLP